jgi:SAM-dependent methyltransferase
MTNLTAMDGTALALGTAVGVAPPEPRTGAERAAAWLVGDTLSCVLHLGDAPLAYVLADQGHEVVVAGADVTVSRHPNILYVRTQGERLPFGAAVFDVVVAPQVHVVPTALAEYARVLRDDGLLSTISRTYDDSIPWMRKLRDTVGQRPAEAPRADTLTASGLFDTPELDDFGTWEELDLPGALRFAAEVKGPAAGDEIFPAVRDLFTSYASQSGTLRLRHQTHCLRARVIRDNLPDEPAPETTLLDFA